MKHHTLQYIDELVKAALITKTLPERRPSPMPGRNWPTRVAWVLHVAQLYAIPGKIGVWRKNHRVIRYIGKPSRYRALQVYKLLTEVRNRKGNDVILGFWEAEFDKAGLVAGNVFDDVHQRFIPFFNQAFCAYHPHSSAPEVVGAFCKPLHVKYVGGMRLYSQKRRLTADAIDAYYNWYLKQFGRRLRRPKAVANIVLDGKVVEAGTPSTGVPEAPEEAF